MHCVHHCNNKGQYSGCDLLYGTDEVGYAFLEHRTITSVYISHIVIHDKYQNKRHGQFLLNQVLSHLKEIGVDTVTLRVKEDNVNAIHIYEKSGFEKISKLSDYHCMQLVL